MASKVNRVPSRAHERETALKLYTETRLPAEEIGAMFGVSRTTIHNWIKSAGVPLRGPMGPRKEYSEREEAQKIVQPEDHHEAVLANSDTLVRIESKLDQVLHSIAQMHGFLDALSKVTRPQ